MDSVEHTMVCKRGGAPGLKCSPASYQVLSGNLIDWEWICSVLSAFYEIFLLISVGKTGNVKKTSVLPLLGIIKPFQAVVIKDKFKNNFSSLTSSMIAPLANTITFPEAVSKMATDTYIGNNCNTSGHTVWQRFVNADYYVHPTSLSTSIFLFFPNHVTQRIVI